MSPRDVNFDGRIEPRHQPATSYQHHLTHACFFDNVLKCTNSRLAPHESSSTSLYITNPHILERFN
jgi:hypothetical protein